MPSVCVSSIVRCGSCSQGSKALGMNSGQRWMTRTNEKPRCLKAACMMSYSTSGTQSTACAMNDAPCTPSDTVSGFIGSSVAP